MGEGLGFGGGDPEALEAVSVLASARDLGDDPEATAGCQQLAHTVEEEGLVFHPPVDQAAGDGCVRRVRQGVEVVGGDVRASPGRVGARGGALGGGEGDGAGGAVDAGGAVAELVVEVTGEGTVAAADVERRAPVAGAEVLGQQFGLGSDELTVAASV